MSITVPLDRVAIFLAQHPWPAIALVFLLGVVLPAVWSTRRHAAAMAVLHVLLDTTANIIAALRTGRRRLK